MKKILILIIILAAGGFGVYLFVANRSGHQARRQEKVVYYCLMHPHYTSDKPGNCPICSMKLVKRETSAQETSLKKASSQKILYWTDPMMPGYKAKGPGKSPMGMDLIPVYEEEQTGSPKTSVEGHASVSLTASKQQLMGVKTEKVTARHLTKTIRAVGTVAHDTQLYQTQAEYLQAAAAFQKAEDSGIPEVAEQAKNMIDVIRLRLIHAGFHDGLIEELKQRGEPDRSLLLVETGPVWVYARIYQYELPYVDAGTPVKVDVPSFSQETFEGVVRAVDPMVDMMTRTVRIRIQIKDAKGVLKPDMYVNAAMDIDLGEILAVPHEAVFHTGTRDVVFVDTSEGVFQPREVMLGAETDEFYEIKSGLKKDEMVVTGGNFLLDSESRLRSTLESVSGAAVDPHAGHKQ